MSHVLETALTTTSMTPRTARKHLQELVRSDVFNSKAQKAEIFYTEAKVAIAQGDTASARVFLSKCPKTYKNAPQYREQCKTYDSLCRSGVLERAALTELRDALGSILEESARCKRVASYAEEFEKAGYTGKMLKALTMSTVDDAVTSVSSMSAGHRMLLRSLAEQNTPWYERWARLLMTVTDKCLRVAERTRAVLPKQEDEEEEDETPEDKDDTLSLGKRVDQKTPMEAERPCLMRDTAFTDMEDETAGDDDE